MSRVRCLHGTQKIISKWKLQVWLFEAHHLRIVSEEVNSERLLTEIHILESGSNHFWQDFHCAPAKFWLAKVKTFSPAKTGFCQDLLILDKCLRSFVFANRNWSTTIILNFTWGVEPKLNFSIFIIICVHYIACTSRIFLEVKHKLIKKEKKRRAKISKDRETFPSSASCDNS